jgi:hypothetical protein
MLNAFCFDVSCDFLVQIRNNLLDGLDGCSIADQEAQTQNPDCFDLQYLIEGLEKCRN